MSFDMSNVVEQSKGRTERRQYGERRRWLPV
jgi:hypothetical protein